MIDWLIFNGMSILQGLFYGLRLQISFIIHDYFFFCVCLILKKFFLCSYMISSISIKYELHSFMVPSIPI